MIEFAALIIILLTAPFWIPLGFALLIFMVGLALTVGLGLIGFGLLADGNTGGGALAVCGALFFTWCFVGARA